MATSTKNVIVGAAALFTSVGNNTNGLGRPRTDAANLTAIGFNTTNSVRQTLLNATGANAFREVGYTTTGLEVSYEPTYGEVMVDQLLDAARLFKQSLKVLLKTELAEATLENLQFTWGQMDNYYAAAQNNTVVNVPALVNNDSTVTGTNDSPSAVLNMAAGALGDAPVERVIVAVGQAPAQIGSSVSLQEGPSNAAPAGGAGSTYSTSAISSGGSLTAASATSVVRQKERVYVARRVVAIDTTMHSMKRDSATVFPVNFRCLPDSDPAYAGAEYGIVIDRVYGSGNY
jgi:hypothetical protein